jgi:hypothetical protein
MFPSCFLCDEISHQSRNLPARGYKYGKFNPKLGGAAINMNIETPGRGRDRSYDWNTQVPALECLEYSSELAAPWQTVQFGFSAELAVRIA